MTHPPHTHQQRVLTTVAGLVDHSRLRAGLALTLAFAFACGPLSEGESADEGCATAVTGAESTLATTGAPKPTCHEDTSTGDGAPDLTTGTTSTDASTTVAMDMGSTGNPDDDDSGLEGFCADVCANIADPVCFAAAECASYCEEQSPGWPRAVQEDFAFCVTEVPLCYLSLEQCML